MRKSIIFLCTVFFSLISCFAFDPNEGELRLIEQSKNGDKDAQFILQVLKQAKTKSDESDKYPKIDLLFKEAESGNRVAQRKIGERYWEGNAVIKDENRAEEWFKKGAENGDAIAEFRYGLILDKKNENDSIKWFFKSAKQGYCPAIMIVARHYERGDGVEKDLIKALAWDYLCRKRGYETGASFLSYINKVGDDGDKKAQAICDELDKQVPFNKEGRIEYLEIVAKIDPDAQFALGALYERGDEEIGFEKNENKALYWLTKAAINGNPDAQYFLGSRFENGTGVKMDQFQAAKWYYKAAEQGDADAQSALGNCYQDGKGLEKDEREAVKWYRKAADQGNTLALFCLGCCYRHGDGVIKDIAEAYAFYNLASVKGNEFKKYRDNLEKEMTMDQIAEGQRRTKELMKHYQVGEK